MLQDAVQRVKTANDIVDVVGGYLALRQAGRVFKALCPFHDDRRPSFDVDPDRQRYRCWACGEYGDVISFVQRIERLDFAESMDFLARRAGISWRENEDSSQSAQKARLLEACEWAQKHFQEALWERQSGKGARDYLEDRGLEEQTLRDYGVGWAPAGKVGREGVRSLPRAGDLPDPQSQGADSRVWWAGVARDPHGRAGPQVLQLDRLGTFHQK
ncbi:MAG: CHC2 zinc finger domain-containing protein [Gemmataceae bacterium]|nr:CHC2 zinc finger domain-containing protein [Gemmataceae bacterium]